jgi:hypothetical protein
MKNRILARGENILIIPESVLKDGSRSSCNRELGVHTPTLAGSAGTRVVKSSGKPTKVDISKFLHLQAAWNFQPAGFQFCDGTVAILWY